jgi:hypothetical protein
MPYSTRHERALAATLGDSVLGLPASSPLDERSVSDTGPVEKLREWFGTPVAAGRTVIWLCWVSLVASVLFGLLLGLLYLLAWGVEAIVT